MNKNSEYTCSWYTHANSTSSNDSGFLLGNDGIIIESNTILDFAELNRSQKDKNILSDPHIFIFNGKLFPITYNTLIGTFKISNSFLINQYFDAKINIIGSRCIDLSKNYFYNQTTQNIVEKRDRSLENPTTEFYWLPYLKQPSILDISELQFKNFKF